MIPISYMGLSRNWGFNIFLNIENIGYAGGILVASTNNNLKTSLICSGDQFIHLQVLDREGLAWNFTAMYTSPNEGNRRIL